MISSAAKNQGASVDSELRDAIRTGDRVRIALLERRQGRAIQVDDYCLLSQILERPWVSTYEWAAVRTSFSSVRILRPGSLHQVPGFQSWMVEKDLPIHVARVSFRDADSSAFVAKWNAMLISWSLERAPTTVLRVPGGYVILPETWEGQYIPSYDEVKTVHTAETWSIEHVRLACGLDPVQPKAPSELGHPGPTIVKTCAICRAVEGRMRADRVARCWDCQKEEEERGL